MNQLIPRRSNQQRIAMPTSRSDEFKIARLFSALLIAVLSPGIACATLGEPEITVQTDVVKLSASIKSSEDRAAYRVHEIQLPTGTVLREFVAPGGNVFAVAWQGPAKPNLRQALGKYFDSMTSAPKTKFSDRKHVRIQQGDLIVEGSGHMRALSGRAYLASAVPTGVNLGDLH
jgi:Protein of unknown function (DUF2844)